METSAVMLAGLGIALAVIILPSILNSRLDGRLRVALVAALVTLHGCLQFVHFMDTDGFWISFWKAGSLSALILGLSVWNSKVSKPDASGRRRMR